jgi:hypothetical protein
MKIDDCARFSIVFTIKIKVVEKLNHFSSWLTPERQKNVDEKFSLFFAALIFAFFPYVGAPYLKLRIISLYGGKIRFSSANIKSNCIWPFIFNFIRQTPILLIQLQIK